MPSLSLRRFNRLTSGKVGVVNQFDGSVSTQIQAELTFKSAHVSVIHVDHLIVLGEVRSIIPQ
jgi:hypothetical protein